MDGLSNFWKQIASLIIILVILMSATAVWIRPSSSTDKNEFVRTFLTAAGGAALLLQLRYTHESTRAATRTLEVTEQRQVTDRFYKAVELLESETTDVRMGALFALERIGQDSDRDYHQVMFIIAAYVRQRAGLRDDQFLEPRSSSHPVTEDIQCALTILGRRSKTHLTIEELPIDLSETDLTKAKLHNANFAGTLFRGCILNESTFDGGTFEGADFSGADAIGARFDRCFLSEADFRGANLSHATFIDFEVRQSSSWRGYQIARMNGAFDGVDLMDATLDKTKLFVEDISTCKGLTRTEIANAYVGQETHVPPAFASSARRLKETYARSM